VLALAMSGATLFVGGDFTMISNETQSNLASFTETPTSVALVTMNAESDANGIRIQWRASGDGIVSASVYRRTAASGWELQGYPEPDAQGYITHVDAGVTPGVRYGYRLVVRDARGEESAAEAWVTAAAGVGAPAVVRLEQARPNPFAARAQLTYGLPRSAMVRLTIHDVQGRLVATVVNGEEPAGWRSRDWDGRDNLGRQVASGTYFQRLEVADKVEVRKVVLAR
jgi:hypothetical protein